MSWNTYTSASRRGRAKASEVRYLRVVCAGPGRLATHTPVILNTVSPFSNSPHRDLQGRKGRARDKQASKGNVFTSGRSIKNISIHICFHFPWFFQVEIEAQRDCSHGETEKRHEVEQNRRVGSSKHPLLWQAAPQDCELDRDEGRNMQVWQHIHLDANWRLAVAWLLFDSRRISTN